jgi:AraC-like DNA-binding protein
MRDSTPEILKVLASQLNVSIADNSFTIPSGFGKGYCTGYVFNEHMRIIISNFELYQDLILRNPDISNQRKRLFFKFEHIFPISKVTPYNGGPMPIPSVLIGTSRLNTDELIAIHTNTATINIEIDSGYLKGLLNLSGNVTAIKSLLDNKQPFLFEQIVYPSIQLIVNEIISEPVHDNFKLFFLKIKAEELVCRLLMELEKRSEKQLYALNKVDIVTIYKVKEKILDRLDVPPSINELSMIAGMSPSKLKRLFKQIFGDSIFSYYQHFRIREAARLLREEEFSVANVGYQLGFTNLSHFSKVFNEHMGLTPKRYSRV